MGSHHGVVDGTPNISDMLGCCCIRYLAIYEIVDSHAIQIHSSYAVIVRTIPTGFAAEDVLFLIAVGLLNVATDRTGLACIPRVHVNNGTPV